MMRDKFLQVRVAGMILATSLVSMAVTSCSSQPRLVDNSPYASNSSIDGGYNPYPSDSGGVAHPGSLLPSHATTTTHHQYTEAPPPPPTGYEAPAHQDKTSPSAGSSTKRSSSDTASRSSTRKPVTSPSKATASKASPSKATASKTSTTKKSSGGSYTVVKGDSLYAIARRKGTTVAKLKSANGLSSDLLSIGQKLKIP